MTQSLAKLFDLSGRVALITGGSRGLGLQMAEALAEYGAKVVLVSRKAADLAEAVEHLAGLGYEAHSHPADLTRAGAPDALVEEVLARHGRIDILVNNAGNAWGAPAEDYPMEAWTKVLDLNLTSVFLMSQAVAKRWFIPAGGGVIVNVASVEGLGAHHPSRPGTVAYNAAKGAVVNMTRALAAEWGPKGIRVNALAPGYFPSKMTAILLDDHGAGIIESTPLGKLGNDDDLKGAALLLASDAGGHITGQIIVVDGGALVI